MRRRISAGKSKKRKDEVDLDGGTRDDAMAGVGVARGMG